uniref:NADH dehydrogenase subunit 4L n=1 Tax=Panagrolaimus sp. JU765 TaxID=591449 RepID=A0AC34QBI1_9BILA
MLFLYYSIFLGGLIYFFFIRFSVISRVIGIVLIVGGVKYFGSDLRVFYRFKLSLKLLVFKTENIFCRDISIN